MKKAIFLIGIIISINGFAAVYEKDNDGVPDFSNTETKDSTKLDLTDHPVTVLNTHTDVQHKTIYWNKSPIVEQQNSDENTLQGAFPEHMTDNYFDFYGRNHHYDSLMSSTNDGGYYDENGANNEKLRSNY